MRVYISADMEGITGQVSWKACGAPSGEHYDFDFARRMMTHDVNAAIRGAKSAGATHILVKDSHGTSRNLLIDQLESGTELVSGEAAWTDGMMTGIDDSFEAAVLIGYHGMAGTDRGVMEHTINGNVHRMWWNDWPVGEIGMSIAAAATYGVPTVAISSDDHGCKEFGVLVEGGATAITKYGLGRYMARCLHPSETSRAIEFAVRDGIQRKSALKPWTPSMPAECKIEFNRSECADHAVRMPGTEKVDAYTVKFHAEDYATLHRAVRALMSLGV